MGWRECRLSLVDFFSEVFVRDSHPVIRAQIEHLLFFASWNFFSWVESKNKNTCTYSFILYSTTCIYSTNLVCTIKAVEIRDRDSSLNMSQKIKIKSEKELLMKDE